MSKTIQIQETIDRTHRVELDDKCVREWLNGQGYDIPENAEVTVRVPGGADWSNESLNIPSDSKIFVTWKSHENVTRNEKVT